MKNWRIIKPSISGKEAKKLIDEYKDSNKLVQMPMMWFIVFIILAIALGVIIF